MRAGEAVDPSSPKGELGTATLRLYAAKTAGGAAGGAELQRRGHTLSLIFPNRRLCPQPFYYCLHPTASAVRAYLIPSISPNRR